MRFGIAAIAAGLLLAAAPSLAQDTTAPATNTPSETIGPRELEGFSLNGTVTLHEDYGVFETPLDFIGRDSSHAIGGEARIIITKKHMYAEVKVGSLKDLDEIDESVRLMFPTESKNKKIHYHASGDEVWINFDYTDHYPGSKFLSSEVYNVITF